MNEADFRQAVQAALDADSLDLAHHALADLYLKNVIPLEKCYDALFPVVSQSQATVPTTVRGDFVVGNKLVQYFFGGTVPPDGAKLLQAYLERVLEQNNRLRFAGQSLSGRGESKSPALQLSEVFQQLVVDGPSQACGRVHLWSAAHARKILARYQPKSAQEVVPSAVRQLHVTLVDKEPKNFLNLESLDSLADDLLVQVHLTRPTLARELPQLAPQCWVLLGAPGSGKSTLLRHLVVSLAKQALDQPDQPVLVPIVCTLPIIAQEFPERYNELANIKAVKHVICHQLEESGSLAVQHGLSQYLDHPLKHGRVLLLFDGLDELSSAPLAENIPSLRAQVVAAISALAEEWPHAPMIVTCRTLAYPVPEDAPHFNQWEFPHPWQTRTVQPFAQPQIRAFVQAWYHQSAHKPGALYNPEQSSERAEQLLAQITERNLHELAASPLLLTMLTFLHYNSERALLPDSEAKLYETWVDLLLDRWHAVSSRKNLIEQMGLQRGKATLESLRHLLQQVAFQAHKHPQRIADGRGILSSFELDGLVIQWLRRIECTDDVHTKMDIFRHYIQADAGLLEATDDHGYAFPHLTFQEYLAACYLAEASDPVEEAYTLWSSTNGDRWRKVLELFAGVLRDRGMSKNVGKHWLDTLLKESSKPAQQLQRDAVLADKTYHILGGDAFARDLEQLQELYTLLGKRLAHVLAHEPLAPLEDRLAAGWALNHYGDPRPGVATLEPLWCHIPAGTYLVGSDDNDPEAYADETPIQEVQLEAFSIAAYPVTNAQFRMFVEDGGYYNRRWWTDAGWDWLQPQDIWESMELVPGISVPIDVLRGSYTWVTAPLYWYEADWNQPNQPVSGTSLYESLAYCAWLSYKLGYRIGLPTEGQWEVAARGLGQPIYPWGNTFDQNLCNCNRVYKCTTPIGCFPDGRSSYGCYDIAGNVCEWTVTDDNDVKEFASIRGGSWFDTPQRLRCDFSYLVNPLDRRHDQGFRICTSFIPLETHSLNPESEPQRG